MFALVLLNIIKDSLDYIWTKNVQEENSFHTENKKVTFVVRFTWFVMLLTLAA